MSINFSAGPNGLALAVQERLLEAAVEFGTTGMSAWETSHRDERIHDAIDRSRALVRELLQVPDEFEILFTQGGATGMFKAWALNLCPAPCIVDVVRSGHWASEAFRGMRELETGGLIQLGAQFNDYRFEPLHPSSFVYMVSNETVNGIQLPSWDLLPLDAPPLVVDMSSDIMMREIDWRRIGLVFASTQKCLGMAFGACLIIVRKDLLAVPPHSLLPAPLSFQEQLGNHRGGLRNTVNPLGVLSVLYTLEWIKEQGGVAAMQAQAAARAKILYDAIDGSDGFFEGLAAPELRSNVNVVLRTRDEADREPFLKFCAHEGCVGLKGHTALAKTAGPHARASMYIGATTNDAENLTLLMSTFRR